MSTTVDRDKQFLPGAEEFHRIYTERKEEFDATFDKLKDIYGAYNGGVGRAEARTYTEYAFRKYQFGRLAAETPPGDEPKWEWLHTAQLPNIIATTRTIQHGLDILKEE
ncbi:MAG: hypothetical protein KDA17_08005, partial [Candidatus Saccharibacteria bacterium]|nr:hypothetical protein [Candidatus Saccharibacteria bacterium]